MKKTKKVTKKPVARVRKPVVTPPAVVARPFFLQNPGKVAEWTKTPTKAAVLAAYGFLDRRGAFLRGSPVLELLGPNSLITKIDKIRGATE